jgi:hypothetical protein
MSTSDAWCSPPEIADPLEEFFQGPVDVDPCSNSRSIIRARMAYAVFGLVRPWGRTTYENNPYSETGAWTEKAIAEMRCGNVRELVRLTMASTSSQWWRRQCLVPRRNPRLLFTKRLKFIDPFAADDGEIRAGSRFEPVLTYFGPRAARFDRCFRGITMWSTWGR